MIQPLFLDGAFNYADPWGIAPTYLWVLSLWWFILIPVTWFVLKRVMWEPFMKFHGLHYAKKNDSCAVLITDDTGDTQLVAEETAKCIFNYGEDDYEIDIPEMPLHIIKIIGIIFIILGIILVVTSNLLLGIVFVSLGIIGYFIDRLIPWVYSKLFWYPTKYIPDIDWQTALLYKIGKVSFDCKIAQILQNGEWDQYPVLNLGGTLVEWVIDSDHWCRSKSRQHRAIVRSARAWNKEHQDDQVHTYLKYQRYLNNGNITPPAEIKKDFIVPWQRVDLGFPFDLKNVDWAGKLRQMAASQKAKSEAAASQYIMLILAGGIGFAIVILLVRLGSKMLSTAPQVIK